MLTPEEQAALDKAAEFVLAFKGRGLSSDEAMTMTTNLLGLFMNSLAGAAAMRTARAQRTKHETP